MLWITIAVWVWIGPKCRCRDVRTALYVAHKRCRRPPPSPRRAGMHLYDIIYPLQTICLLCFASAHCCLWHWSLRCRSCGPPVLDISNCQYDLCHSDLFFLFSSFAWHHSGYGFFFFYCYDGQLSMTLRQKPRGWDMFNYLRRSVVLPFNSTCLLKWDT